MSDPTEFGQADPHSMEPRETFAVSPDGTRRPVTRVPLRDERPTDGGQPAETGISPSDSKSGGGTPTPPLDLASLREMAEKAIVGDPIDKPDFPGEWEAWFNFHGDPYVVEKDRGQWSIVATISSAPEDYGKARAEFIGTTDPATVLALLDEIERLTTLAYTQGVLAERYFGALRRLAQYDEDLRMTNWAGLANVIKEALDGV